MVPAPDAVTEAGEKLPDELVDPAAATPKPKTEAEIEDPLAETAQGHRKFGASGFGGSAPHSDPVNGGSARRSI